MSIERKDMENAFKELDELRYLTIMKAFGFDLGAQILPHVHRAMAELSEAAALVAEAGEDERDLFRFFNLFMSDSHNALELLRLKARHK